jgi:tRNA dimethylallyltransferase
VNKLLVISGPTATGKTALAVKFAKEYNGELISADSRQIYQGLDIGVGKDHPAGTPIHLIDLITPDQSFSVAGYRQLAIKVIADLHGQNKLPILVGCSGFYIDSVINPNYSTFSVKPNFALRFVLNHLPVSIVKLTLKIIDRKTFEQLNNSDINNPLRLIRKIEIKLSPRSQKFSVHSKGKKGEGLDVLHLSLTAPNQFLYSRIDLRVEERLKMGHLNELNNLLKIYNWSDPGLKVSAYSSFNDFLNNKISLPEAVQKWKFLEHRDSRRQKTWFKKRSSTTFIDISNPFSSKKAGSLVQRWYNNL